MRKIEKCRRQSMKLRKAASLLAVCIFTLFLTAGCQGRENSPGKRNTDGHAGALSDSSIGTADRTDMGETAEMAGEPIRIGAIYALSGNNAAIGTNILRGIDFAAEEINRSGGIDGRPVEIIRGDTEGDSGTARETAERLITEERVHAILGCHQSTLTEVVSQVCEEYRIPMITAISTVDRKKRQDTG